MPHRATAVLVVFAPALGACGTAEPPAASERPRFVQAVPHASTPRARAASTRRYLTARLTRATLLRARPRGPVLHRLGTRTEFGSQAVLGVVGRRDGWVKVISARLPNHRRGWIPEDATALHGTDYDIRVDRSQRRAALRHDGRALMRFRVAVGRPGNETPLGRFAVTDKLRPSDPTSPYGCCAVALSGHQTRLEPGWPGGDRLAIHGTPAPQSIGEAVSLGCLRADSRLLERLLERVPLGAPVFIRA